jgi:hypothetical protein
MLHTESNGQVSELVVGESNRVSESSLLDCVGNMDEQITLKKYWALPK